MSTHEIQSEIMAIKLRLMNERLTALEAARLTTALIALYESLVAIGLSKAA